MSRSTEKKSYRQRMQIISIRMSADVPHVISDTCASFAILAFLDIYLGIVSARSRLSLHSVGYSE